MKRQEDVVIIGAGIVGVCTAYFLLEQGRGVAVLDQGDVCSGSSYGNAGAISPSHAIPLAAPGAVKSALKWMFNPESPFYLKPRFDPELFSWFWRFWRACDASRVREVLPFLRDLERESLKLFASLVEKERLECDFRQKGALYLFNSAAGYAHGVKEAQLLQEYGIGLEILDGPAVREFEPMARPSIHGGIRLKEDAHLDPARFVRGLAEAVKAKGGDIHPYTEAVELRTEGRQVRWIRTTRGTVRPAHVVLAAGAHSSRIARDLGVRLPIEAAKGYSVMVKRGEACPKLPTLLKEARVYVTPLGDRIRFAGTFELAGANMAIARRRLDALAKAVDRYLSGFGGLEEVEVWRGLRPMTPDAMPILGKAAAADNLTYATGHGMVGVGLGAVSGKIAADLAAGQPPPFDLRLLAPSRFGA
jgi:D-amino-acid dehydrogenase